jgi:uncharacterized membrane protein
MRLSAVRRLTLVAATIATGLAAGFFYAYHVSVTRGHALVGDRMNEDLATVSLAAADLPAVRADYEQAWNRANALRTGLSVAAFALLVAAVAGDRRRGSAVDSAHGELERDRDGRTRAGGQGAGDLRRPPAQAAGHPAP